MARDRESGDSSFEAMLKKVAAAPHIEKLPNVPLPLAPGVEIGGAFRIESTLGRGAMGVVYLATDLALDRPVALKMHTAAADALGSRMWREAKAMARLSHPNVITVYEVGTYDGRVFIAMELVEGGTLREWLEAPRTWQEIVEVFEQAARGLAAAHRVGLVHRDFKPTNVLVGADGRVRVADFGLARSTDAVEHEPSGEQVVVRSPSLEEPVTATGALVGTPFYMAPELSDGSPATQRADQYSFWLSLYEALHGTRPGPGKKGGGASNAVPKWLRAALTRGLSEDPNDRFESMDEVIAALTTRTSRWTVAMAAAGGVGTMVLLGAGADAWADARGRDSCLERAEAISQVLGPGPRSRLDEAMRSTELPFAANTVARMQPILDGYVDEWAQRFSEACVAAEVDKTVPSARWAATEACLGERSRAAEAWIAAMSDAPDTGMVRDAVASAGRLAPLSACSDEAWLARNPAGEHGELASRKALRESAALYAAGRHERAFERVQALLGANDPNVRAEALILAGEIGLERADQEAALEHLAAGFELALARGLDDSALEAATELVYAAGVQLRRFEEAKWWARLTRGLLQRLGLEDSYEAAALHSNLGVTYEAEHRFDEALSEHRQALAMYLEHLGERHPEIAFTHNNIGTTLLSLGRVEEATEELEFSTSLLEGLLGAEHPSVALGLSNLGMVYRRQDRLEDAERVQRRAVEAFESGGESDPLLATAYANLGGTLLALERYDAAEREIRRSLGIAETLGGPKGAKVGHARHQLGNLFFAQKQYEAAAREHALALEIAIAEYGPKHPRAATSHHNLGRAQQALGREDDAHHSFEQAVAINLEARGADHPQTAVAQLSLGKLELERGNVEVARSLLEAARDTFVAKRPPEDPERRDAEALAASL